MKGINSELTQEDKDRLYSPDRVSINFRPNEYTDISIILIDGHMYITNHEDYCPSYSKLEDAPEYVAMLESNLNDFKIALGKVRD